ncbi:MAG: hypothetical protein ACE5HS_12035 [bacterium]
MDRFVEFEEEVAIADLKNVLEKHNPGIMILRFSKLTGALKIRTNGNLNKREIKRAFLPYKVRKIYDDFPLKEINN